MEPKHIETYCAILFFAHIQLFKNMSALASGQVPKSQTQSAAMYRWKK